METKCAYCGDTFEAIRSSAKYCSDTCRVKYNNLPNLLERDFDGIVDRLNQIADTLASYPELTIEIDEYLQRVSNLVHHIQYHQIDAMTLRNMQNERNNVG